MHKPVALNKMTSQTHKEHIYNMNHKETKL